MDEERQEEVKLKKAAFVGQGRFNHESDAVVGIAPIRLPHVWWSLFPHRPPHPLSLMCMNSLVHKQWSG